MYVELDPILPVLLGLVLLVLGAATARTVGAKAWWLLAVVLLIGLGANPSRERHMDAVHRQARDGLEHHAVDTHPPLERAPTGPLAEYQDFGVASVLTLQGKIQSIGLLGQVWVIDASRPTRCMRADVHR